MNTTLLEQFQNPLKSSLKEAKSIPLTHFYMSEFCIKERVCAHLIIFNIFLSDRIWILFFEGESAYTFHIFWHFLFDRIMNFVLRRECIHIPYFLTFCIWPNHEFCFKERDLTHSIFFDILYLTESWILF